MKHFKEFFRAFVRMEAGFLARTFAAYTRENFFRRTPKAVMSLIQSVVNEMSMVTTDAGRYMELLFDTEAEDGVNYLVPCAEWVNYMECLQVREARVREA